MAKLYLIRRNLETFAGPMTLSEMKEAYKRLSFGLQDEVSGHCGPWVSFDNLAAIRQSYPEVARIVNEEMLAGWGVSEHGTKIEGEETRRVDVKSTRGIGLALTFLAIALIAFAAAVYMANSARLSGKAGTGGDLSVEEPQALVDRGDSAAFDAWMQDNARELVDRTNKWKKGESPWLPYLRLWAFSKEGAIDGLAPKLLRGNANAAPVDCSLKMWRRRWRASMKSWTEIVNQHHLVRSHWARLLAWDPHWIRRRDNKGWVGSLNYYVGCLAMADKALTEMYSDPSLVTSADDWARMGIDKVKQRLVWTLEVARDGQSALTAAPSVDNDLSVWTCFEGARDLKELNRCRDGMPPAADEAWASYNEERYGWGVLRLTMGVKGPLAGDLATALSTWLPRLPRADFYTRFDYRAEQKLARVLAKQPGPVEKTIEKTQAEFPDVRLAH
jgi:hypothetical protein